MYAVTHCVRYHVLPVGFVSHCACCVIVEAPSDDQWSLECCIFCCPLKLHIAVKEVLAVTFYMPHCCFAVMAEASSINVVLAVALLRDALLFCCYG